MLTRFRSAVSKSRLRQREIDRRHARRRTLRAEPLEGRLLLSVDSWVLPTGIPNGTGSYFPVAADDAGSVYVAATRYDGSATQPDICLNKYSSDGQLVWTNDLGLPGYQRIMDVAVGNDGVYIVGLFEGTVNLDPSGGDGGILQTPGGFDGYLAKYGIADGTFLWAHQLGGTGNDSLGGVAVSEECVFVTGTTEISVRNKVRTDQLVASVSSDGLVRWEKTVVPIGGYPPDIAVFTPPSAPANVYISGTGGAGGYVAKLTETVDGQDALLDWTFNLGENTLVAGLGGIAVGTVDNGGNPLPSIYVLFYDTTVSDKGLLKISDTGNLLWSTSMDAYPWGVAVDGATAYVTGRFSQQADFGGTLLTSRGENDGFLARYSTDEGRLLAAQRMGGNTEDQWRSVAVGNGNVYAGGFSTSTNGDFPAGLPGEMSAFVPGNPQSQMFVMQLDTAAPIVQVAETDISVAPDTPRTLHATTSAGTITWYEAGNAIGTGADLTVTLGLGTHQISAIATDDAGLIGMAGVVVTVAPPATLAINNVSQAEGRRGTTNFAFTVTRGGGTSESVTVSYATANGTATAGSDYNATSGTLAFAAGETSKTITVSVIGDRTAEPNETFFVNLSNVVGGTIDDGQGLGTIQNDDGAALMAAFGEQAGGQIVTLDQAERLLPLAVALWSTSSHAAVPAQLTVELDDLPSGQLGAAFGHTVTLDTDANGAGWYADRAAASAGRVDLLTVLAHEVGHLLGYDHSALADDLMAATLPAGTRRLPDLGPIDSSPLLLPETRLNVSHSDLVDQTLLTSEVDRGSGADNALWLLPVLPTDDVDRPRFSAADVQARLFQTIADEETELLDEALLDLIAISQK